HLFSKSGIRTFMDATARQTWDDAIEKQDVPALTIENVTATFAAMYGQRREMFERGVVAVFRSLSWDYKTNNPVKCGKRIVLRYIIRSRGWYVSTSGCDKLGDLVRVFRVLDAKPEPDHRASTWRTLHDLRWPEQQQLADLDYFTIRGFKNGNGHL